MTKIILFALSLSMVAILSGDPWGKDADMAYQRVGITAAPSSCTTPFLGPFAEAMIRFHQQVISPADGPRSHFLPSSSQYTLDAMRKHGFIKGFFRGCDRLMRENDEAWVYRKGVDENGKLMKLDPLR